MSDSRCSEKANKDVATGIIPSGGTLNQIVRHVGQTYPLPTVISGVLDLMRTSEVDGQTHQAAQSLQDCIESDPQLCEKLLAILNRSLPDGVRVNDVGEAIAQVGVQRVEFHTLGIGLPSGLLHHVNPNILSYYWKFTLFKALAAERLAAHLAGPDTAATVFCAAMMHDVGILAMVHELGAPYEKFLGHIIGEPSTTILEKEADTLGFDHRVLGAKMLLEWGFPDQIVELVKLRLDPKSVHPLNEPMRSKAQALHVADLLACFWIQPTSELGQQIAQLKLDYWGNTVLAFCEQFEDVASEFKNLVASLQIECRDWRDVSNAMSHANDRLFEFSNHVVDDVPVSSEVPVEPGTHHPLDLPPQADSQQHAPEEDVAAGNDRTTPNSESQPEPLSVFNHDLSTTASPSPHHLVKAAGITDGRVSSRPKFPTTNSCRGDLAEFLEAEVSISRENRTPLTLMLGELLSFDQWALVGGLNVAERMTDTLVERLRESHLSDTLSAVAFSASSMAFVFDTDNKLRITQWVRELPQDFCRFPPLDLSNANDLPGLSFGVACMRYVPKNFEVQRLLEPAQRCLRAAGNSGTNVTSVDVL
jgi:HD-like signal output (HDOD) protein